MQDISVFVLILFLIGFICKCICSYIVSNRFYMQDISLFVLILFLIGFICKMFLYCF